MKKEEYEVNQQNQIESVSEFDTCENEKTYTQEQINSIVAKENAKTLEKALKELGFCGEGRAKEQLVQFKASLQEQGSMLEALQAEKTKLEDEISSIRTLHDEQMLKNALLKAGVIEEEMENAIKIAQAFLQSGYEIPMVSELILEKYPHLCSEKAEIPCFSIPVVKENETISKIKNIFKGR